jgi:hypothetical protein
MIIEIAIRVKIRVREKRDRSVFNFFTSVGLNFIKEILLIKRLSRTAIDEAMPRKVAEIFIL